MTLHRSQSIIKKHPGIFKILLESKWFSDVWTCPVLIERAIVGNHEMAAMAKWKCLFYTLKGSGCRSVR